MVTFVTGTFDATGQSEIVKVTRTDFTDQIALSLTHAGTATVTLERRVDGSNWRTYASYTASVEAVIALCGGESWRLNCTAHTDDVAYFLGAPRG